MDSRRARDLPTNPRQNSNFISKMLFWYTLPIFLNGNARTLETRDLYKVLNEHKSDVLGEKLWFTWEKELKKRRMTGKKPSLLKATLRIFQWNFLYLGLVLLVLELGLRCFLPMVLFGIIEFYSHEKQEDGNGAYYLTACFIGLTILITHFVHPYMLSALHIGMKIRVAMGGLIYRKTLRLYKNTARELTTAEVIQLISKDTANFNYGVIFLHYLWIAPLQICLITYLMYTVIGISAIFGVALMLSSVPLQILLSKLISLLRLRAAKRTDIRVNLMNEIISGIQVIKMYAWEIPFGKKVAFARKKEINTIKMIHYIRGILLSLNVFLVRISIFLSLIGFWLLENLVTPEKAFVIVAYYNILRPTITICLPKGISYLSEVLVSIKRIENFMMLEETNWMDKAIDASSPRMRFLKPYVGIAITNFKAKWDTKSPEYTLEDINLRINPATLVAIIGPVGSGKSSLIQAILGEIHPLGGTAKVRGSISYISQVPWIFKGTIRQNILFGETLQRNRYINVIRRCALERDIISFTDTDKTMIGDGGVILSIEQKKRICLARAVYRNAEIYLFDNLFDGIDEPIGRHIYTHCLRGFLGKEIVLLITQQRQFFQDADQIIIMDKGKVSAVGTYDKLLKRGIDFAQMLSGPDKVENDSQIVNETMPSSTVYDMIFRDRAITEMSFADLVAGYSRRTTEKLTSISKKVSFSFYQDYFEAGGGCYMFTIMMVFCFLAQFLASFGDYFVAYWVSRTIESDGFESNTKQSEVLEENLFPKNIYEELKEFVSPEMLDIYIFFTHICKPSSHNNNQKFYCL